MQSYCIMQICGAHHCTFATSVDTLNTCIQPVFQQPPYNKLVVFKVWDDDIILSAGIHCTMNESCRMPITRPFEPAQLILPTATTACWAADRCSHFCIVMKLLQDQLTFPAVYSPLCVCTVGEFPMSTCVNVFI